MPYPLIDRQLLADLRLAHGAFNVFVMLLFFYQGRIGLRIRRARRAGASPPFPMIKRHRRAGPVLVILGGLGFLEGLTLVLLDTGNVLEYPPHFFPGLTIVILLIATYKISRDIKGTDSLYRTPHFVLGVAILCVYIVNVMIGIGVLLRDIGLSRCLSLSIFVALRSARRVLHLQTFLIYVLLWYAKLL